MWVTAELPPRLSTRAVSAYFLDAFAREERPWRYWLSDDDDGELKGGPAMPPGLRRSVTPPPFTRTALVARSRHEPPFDAVMAAYVLETRRQNDLIALCLWMALAVFAAALVGAAWWLVNR